MKLSCKQKNLNLALSLVSKFVASKTTTLPILNNILLTTDKGRLKVSATNLEIGINTWVGAKIDKEGSYTIPSRLFMDFVSTNNDEIINISLKDNSLMLESDKYKAKIKGIDSSEFPLIPNISNSSPILIPAVEFKQAILETVFACALDETRPILNGLFLSLKENRLALVATDSYRLAEKVINLKNTNNIDVSVIVPARTMMEVSRIINTEEEISIILGDNQIQFNIGETELVSRVIEGNFPDYKQIIPKSYSVVSDVNVNELKNAIKMASYFVRESANNIRLKIESESLTISSFSSEVGDSLSQISAKTEGEGLEVIFNAKYILDVLNIVSSTNAQLKFNDKTTPCLISPLDTKDYIYIISPIRVEE
jgi:DNA polymerase-3 subunit beta